MAMLVSGRVTFYQLPTGHPSAWVAPGKPSFARRGNMGGAWRALDTDLSGRISLLERKAETGGEMMVILKRKKTRWRWVGFSYSRFVR